MTWEVHNHITEIHVIPVDDIKEHQTHPSCWCQPEVDFDAPDLPDPFNVVMYVHNAGDGREQYEALQ